MKKWILASASPRRQEIFSLLKIPFEIVVPQIEEKVTKKEDIAETALLKARYVQEKNRQDNVFILAADTVVVLEDKILGKPKDKQDAFQMLCSLSGKVHSVYTGVVILHSKTQIIDTIETKVFISPITEEEIETYIAEEDIMDAAGSYKIQGSFSRFVYRIEGDYWNIVGLPLFWVYQNIKNLPF